VVSRTPDPIIELKNVSKTFGESREVLKDLSLRIDRRPEGDLVILLGPSGCGKSTILSLISGIALPDAGEVFVQGKPVRGPDKNSATVFQAYTCFPWLTVQQNVEYGLKLDKKSKAERKSVADEYLASVNLAERYYEYPRKFSGGEKQRIAIARTLATGRPIVLMDEPFGALDAQTRENMQTVLLRLWSKARNTIIFVTHDLNEALVLGTRVIMFASRPAKIVFDKRFDQLIGNPDRILHRDLVKGSAELRKLLKEYGPAKIGVGDRVHPADVARQDAPPDTLSVSGSTPAPESSTARTFFLRTRDMFRQGLSYVFREDGTPSQPSMPEEMPEERESQTLEQIEELHSASDALPVAGSALSPETSDSQKASAGGGRQ
jgi:ABC-type nitrate/sulfonate/bicarbonate transport system ATPase subunit